jgi:hypothetical protein
MLLIVWRRELAANRPQTCYNRWKNKIVGNDILIRKLSLASDGLLKMHFFM